MRKNGIYFVFNNYYNFIKTCLTKLYSQSLFVYKDLSLRRYINETNLYFLPANFSSTTVACP